MRVIPVMVYACATPVESGPVTVRSPRSCDAVGVSLRRIYSQTVDLPQEFARLVQKLS